MKKLLALLLFICVAIGQVGSAQDLFTPDTLPAQSVTAKTVQRFGGSPIWRFRGSVRIVQDTAVITADEVDARIAPDGTLDYDLRGNVHIKLGHK